MALGLLAALVAGGFARPAAAEGVEPVRTEPAANAVTAAPAEIALFFDDAVEPAGGTVSVLGSDGAVAATGELTASAAAPDELLVSVPTLPDGIYTVVWSLPAAGATGSFAFDVDPSGAVPAVVSSPKTAFALKPTKNVLVDWVPWLTIMTFVGVLMLRFVGTGPAARRMSDPARAAATLEATDRRLVRVAAVALVVFIPATVAQLAFELGGTSFAYSKIWESFGIDGDGHVWMARFVFTALAAILIVPAAIRPRAYGPRLRAVMLGGLVLGLLELVARVVPTAVPLNKPRTYFGDLFTLGHIVGGAIWIGGLVGLAALGVRNGVPAAGRGQFWPTVVRRFSNTAMLCVAAVVLSGLWLYWVHVGAISQLGTTLYGRTLLVKLIFVAALIALGGVNHLWLKPHLEARHSVRDEHGISRLVANHFTTVVAAEVVCGMAALFAFSILGGSSRNQDFQAKAADITQSASAGGVGVELTPSGLLPGLTDYDVVVDGGSAKTVSMTFSSEALGVPPHTVPAEPAGDGHFAASGFYTSMVGDWDVAVAVDGVAEQAHFTLPVAAEAEPLPKSRPPLITSGTWLWGIGEVLVVIIALFGTTRLAGLLTRRRSAHAATTTPAAAAPVV